MADSGTTLGRILTIALGAVVIGAVGMYVLDAHAHTCECGHRWRHLGAFNLGSESAHTCSRCGARQWWKDGVPAEVRALHKHWRPDGMTGMVEDAAPYPPEVMAGMHTGTHKAG